MHQGIVDKKDYDNVDIRYAVIVIQDPTTGEVLLTKRASHMRKHAGEFCFPGGKQEDKEDIPTAALRELYEETGLTISDVYITHPTDLPYAATTYTTGLTFGVVYANIRIPKDEIENRLLLNPEEVELVKWFSPDNYEIMQDDSEYGMRVLVDDRDGEKVVGATADVLYSVFSQ